MSEQIARDQQYQYKEMSNLVLQADKSQRYRAAQEPTGEPESLWGRVDPKRMGDRAERARPTEELERGKKRAEKTAGKPGAKKKHAQLSSVLDAVDEFEGLAYKPRTKETRENYALILHFVHLEIGDQSQELLRGATDEILAVMKDKNSKELDKKREVEYILGEKLDADKFSQLMNLTKKIGDYEISIEEREKAATGADQKEGGMGMDEEMGVAVVFDEDDDEEEEQVYELQEEEEEEELGEDEAREGSAEIQTDEDEEDGEDMFTADASRKPKAESKTAEISPRDIDAFWLQRTVSSYFPDDPHYSQQLTTKILDILSRLSQSVREIENSLVQLLNFDKFELVKLLVKNREMIYWCTRLAKAGPIGDERDSIEQEMADAGAFDILKALKTSTKESVALAKEVPGEPKKGTKREAMELDEEDQEEVKRPLTMAEKISERAPRKLLDLDTLMFKHGAHTMTNKKCELPQGSFKTTKKSYEEVTIPAPKTTPMKTDELLISITSLPEWSQAAFKGAKTLNRIQSRVFETAFGSDENMLLCAPTGAGKTNCAMLTILHELSKHRDAETGQFNLDAFKIVYVAPMKALVAEMVGNFSARLTDAYGIRVAELTGDRQLTKAQIAETQIIVTTPEKWDIVTRKSTDRSYTNLVRLIIIDEIHLLHDERGPVLESIVSRTIRNIEQTQEMCRLVGLSATLPNYHDVATFLRVDRNIGLFYFDNSFRPCPLQQQYIGITEKKVTKRFQLMNEITYEKCLAEAGKNQILVFVHSRKETAKTAKAIRDMAMENNTIAKFLKQDSTSREILTTEADTCKNKDLQELLPYGFAIHHAGMTRADRTLVEELFADGHVQILVSTATLAWGVNLPAHTVIIKGTQVYSPEKGSWTELSPQDVLQMLGRAGRPQYDTFGEGIIITTHGELQYYLSLLNTQLPIESQFISKLADMLNAEIVLGTIRNRTEAAEWLGYTYLYVRMLRDPHLYGISQDEKQEDPYLDQKRVDLVHAAALQLDKAQLIKYDRKTGRFQVTELGRIASHYYIGHNSMATYNQNLKPSSGIMDLFRIFSLSEEFRFIPVRSEEKMELSKLLERVPIPVKESVDEPVSKVNALLQAHISQLKLEGFALISDMVYVTQSANRLLRAIFEICLRRGWSHVSRLALDLCKMVDKRMWLSMTPLRQFRGVNLDLLRRLEKKEFPWDRMVDLNPQELGELVRNPKAGKLLHELVHKFPKLELQAHVQPITRSVLRMDLTVTPDFTYDAGTPEKPGVHNPGGELFHVLVEDPDGEKILYCDQFVLKPKYATEDHHLSFTVPLFEPLPPNYFISLISDRWMHSETKLPVSFKHLILPAKFPPHTELLDLQPLPVSALGVSDFVELYSKNGRRYFNPIQTQCFQSLFTTSNNIFIGAPTGSGKTTCAEIAIFRQFILQAKSAEQAGKIVYVTPLPELCEERYLDWKRRLGKLLGGKVVVKLTGETSTDLKLLEQGDIIVSIPEHWDMISRRWRQRRNVQNTCLFIVDEAHLIGAQSGHVLEIIIARMRFIASQLERDIRIVALSTSLGNARDLGEWIGCGAQNSGDSTVFNFHPNVRPVKLEIHLQAFNIPHFPSLMMAMGKPAYLGISQYCTMHDRMTIPPQAIVFVPNRKQSRLTAAELVAYATAESARRKFLHLPDLKLTGNETDDDVDTLVEEQMGPMLTGLSDMALRATLCHGVGYFHEALLPSDKRIVLRLYQRGIIQVLVASRETAYALFDPDTGVSPKAHLAVIMNTQYYDGQEHRYVDYSLAEVLQMFGKASKGDLHGSEHEEGVAHVMLMCPAQKKEFYKKFLYEGLPVESHLDHYLHDHFNAEIVTKTIQSKQDAVDYLTWTYLYRRMTQNPNYYNLLGTTHRHLSDHLSELVENTLSDLSTSKCIAIDEDETSVSALNLGMIAAYYNIHYTTMEVLSMSLTSGTKLRGLLEIISSASEFEPLPIRHREDILLSRLYERCPIRFGEPLPQWTNPHHKTNILLQSHFSRLQLPADLTSDLHHSVLNRILPILYATVDVLSSHGWLSPCLSTMELCQMTVQALWGDRESPLRQLPYFDTDRIERAKKMGVDTVFALLEVEEDVRASILSGLSPSAVGEVAAVANRYPNVELQYALTSANEDAPKSEEEEQQVIHVQAEDAVFITIQLSREQEEEDEDEEDNNQQQQQLGPIPAPFFPQPKDEGWWLIIGNVQTRTLVSIKRLTLQQQYQCRMDFYAPMEAGTHTYQLYLMSDCWIGCDQEYTFQVHVTGDMEE